MREIEFKDCVKGALWVEIWRQNELFCRVPRFFARALKKAGALSKMGEDFPAFFLSEEKKMATSYAVYLLSMRSLFIVELQERLKEKGFSIVAIDEAIHYCQKIGALSDRTRLISMIKKMQDRGKSCAYIRAYIHQFSLDPSMVEELIQEYATDPKQTIGALIHKRKDKAFSSDIKVRQKEIQFLLRRGFRLEDILSVIRK